MQHSLSQESVGPSIEPIMEFGIEQIQFRIALSTFTFQSEDDESEGSGSNILEYL